MTKPEHTRPFSLEQAKAGAPYCCRDGDEATVLKWDGRNQDFPLSGVLSNDDIAACWAADGRFLRTYECPSDLVITPLGYIDGKPVFVGDEIVMYAGTESARTTQALPHNRGFTDCTWPAPARQYPVTGMSSWGLADAYSACDGGPPVQWLAVANAALRHAIDNGQLFTKEDKDTAYNKGLNDGLAYTAEQRKAREMAIAEAVRKAALIHAGARGYFLSEDACELGSRIAVLDLAGIIASVKP